MANRLPSALRAFTPARTAPTFAQRFTSIPATRSFQTSRRLMADTVVRKPVGAFRGSLFGFLLGTVLAGSGLYYYVIDEYKVSNGLLLEDVYALQSAVQRLEGYVKGLEEEVKSIKK